MTEVYLVAYHNPEGSIFAGIFTDKTLAEKAVKDLNSTQVAKARKLFPDSRKDLATALSNIRFWSWYRISTFQTNQLGKFDLEQIEKYKVEKS